MNRTSAVLLTTLFLAAGAAPLVGASTEPTTNGDVIVNGAFADARPIGHPQKLYCDANNPTPAAGPSGECAHANEFVAFDWTTPVDSAGTVELVDGGIAITGNAFIQQHFNGSDAPDRVMRVFHVTVRGASLSATTSKLDVEVRADVNGDSVAETYEKTVSFSPSGSTIDLTASDLGLPAGDVKLRSLRLWAHANADLLLSRVSVYATNGVEARNINIVPAGDDVTTELDGVMMLNPGDDGKYSFLVGMASDSGQWLPALDAYLCAYTAEQAAADFGFPENAEMCQDAFVKANDARITKTRVGDAFRIDVAASALMPAATQVPAIAIYGLVKIDASYDIERPGVEAEFKSGYFNLARLAATRAGAGVAQETPFPTPVVIDSDADGVPDHVQTQDADGYSVIITPQLATITPGLAVVTPSTDAEYLFDIQVYQYDLETGTGAAMDIPRGVSLGFFDASSAVNGGTADATPFWRTDDEGTELERIDAKTWRVHVPMDAIDRSTPVGAWAFYNVGEGQSTNVFGRSTSSTDFFSAPRNAVKGFAVADVLRSAMTPILFEAASLTRDATFVVRLDGEADAITPLDGTLVMGDAGDGTITFEYALAVPDGRTIIPTESHAIAIYDAAGAASDRFQPGASFMEHAEWTGVGALQSDGWFRVDVPVSAFADAKGAVGVWGYADTVNGDGSLLSRSGWYNLLKPAAIGVSTSAAEKALYEPTPIVLLDNELGIPAMLASALEGAGRDLVSPANPLVNPGFEADLLVEGALDNQDATSATMTSPPWFFRLDDKGTGQPTNPRSTHEVVVGKGPLRDHALQVKFNVLDKGKTLMLGQILGNENGGDALVWEGASEVSFDFATQTDIPVKFTANLRYLAEDGTVKAATGRATLGGSSTMWQLAKIPVTVPAGGKLLGFYLVMDANDQTIFEIDNVAIAGVQTALGDRRSDLTDGYAVVIEPVGLAGGLQGVVQGVSDDYYAYVVEVIDYAQGGARPLDLAGLGHTFALRTQELQKEGGVVLPLRSTSRAFAAFYPADEIPAAVASPWAFVDAGPAYATLGTELVNAPASGHYNPVKNAIKGTVFADQLDYAATPIAFGSDVFRTQAAQQTIALTPVPGGHGVVVKGDSPYVETTTLSLTAPNAATRTYPVTLDSADGDRVDGLVLTDADLQTLTLTTADTMFTRGATLVAGSPIASFEVCRPGFAGCVDDLATTLETLTFRSTSTSPSGEPITSALWRFGDGATASESDAVTTHAYQRPGSKLVQLTVSTTSGKSATVERAIAIDNRIPTITGISVSPGTVFADSVVVLTANAADADGGALTYSWTIDNAPIAGAAQRSLTLTPAILQQATGLATLQKREYALGVTVNDGQGGMISAVGGFTVIDRITKVAPVDVEVSEGSTFPTILVGDVVRLETRAVDVDDEVYRVTVDVVHAGVSTEIDLAYVEETGSWVGVYGPVVAGEYSVRGLAYPVGGYPTSGPTRTFAVVENTLPTFTFVGADLTEAGSTQTYTIEAEDADLRGIASIQVLEGATVLASADGADDLTVDIPMPTFGTRMITARVTDVSGGVVDTSILVRVDDNVAIEVTLVREAAEITEGHQVKVRLVRNDGTPIAGATVLIEDLYALLPQPVDTQEVTTDANGEAIVDLAPEGVLVGLPVDRTVRASTTVASATGAPVQDDESASDELALRNSSGPFAGLPLP